MLTSLTKGGEGVSQLLTITDNGGGGQTPQIWLTIICNQSLLRYLVTYKNVLSPNISGYCESSNVQGGNSNIYMKPLTTYEGHIYRYK